jgi:hypothetical protein
MRVEWKSASHLERPPRRMKDEEEAAESFATQRSNGLNDWSY